MQSPVSQTRQLHRIVDTLREGVQPAPAHLSQDVAHHRRKFNLRLFQQDLDLIPQAYQRFAYGHLDYAEQPPITLLRRWHITDCQGPQTAIASLSVGRRLYPICTRAAPAWNVLAPGSVGTLPPAPSKQAANPGRLIPWPRGLP